MQQSQQSVVGSVGVSQSVGSRCSSWSMSPCRHSNLGSRYQVELYVRRFVRAQTTYDHIGEFCLASRKSRGGAPHRQHRQALRGERQLITCPNGVPEDQLYKLAVHYTCFSIYSFPYTTYSNHLLTLVCFTPRARNISQVGDSLQPPTKQIPHYGLYWKLPPRSHRWFRS